MERPTNVPTKTQKVGEVMEKAGDVAEAGDPHGGYVNRWGGVIPKGAKVLGGVLKHSPDVKSLPAVVAPGATKKVLEAKEAAKRALGGASQEAARPANPGAAPGVNPSPNPAAGDSTVAGTKGATGGPAAPPPDDNKGGSSASVSSGSGGGFWSSVWGGVKSAGSYLYHQAKDEVRSINYTLSHASSGGSSSGMSAGEAGGIFEGSLLAG